MDFIQTMLPNIRQQLVKFPKKSAWNGWFFEGKTVVRNFCEFGKLENGSVWECMLMMMVEKVFCFFGLNRDPSALICQCYRLMMVEKLIYISVLIARDPSVFHQRFSMGKAFFNRQFVALTFNHCSNRITQGSLHTHQCSVWMFSMSAPPNKLSPNLTTSFQ